MLKKLSNCKFQAHLTAFALMVLASLGMVFTLRSEVSALTWVMVVLFAAANVLAIFIK
jgi:hypothetical protein